MDAFQVNSQLNIPQICINSFAKIKKTTISKTLSTIHQMCWCNFLLSDVDILPLLSPFFVILLCFGLKQAAPDGFEPSNAAVKVLCLTPWRRGSNGQSIQSLQRNYLHSVRLSPSRNGNGFITHCCEKFTALLVFHFFYVGKDLHLTWCWYCTMRSRESNPETHRLELFPHNIFRPSTSASTYSATT